LFYELGSLWQQSESARVEQPFLFTQPNSHLYCLFEASRIGHTFAGDVEGRATRSLPALAATSYV